MKRLALFVIVGFMALPVLAFNPGPVAGDRIAVLSTSAGEHETSAHVAAMVQRYLAGELQSAGFDAFDTSLTYDDLAAGSDAGADFYVELVGGERTETQEGDVLGVGGGWAAAEMGTVVARVAAGLRLYDARTLELIDAFRIKARDVAFVPTAIAVGGRFGVWVDVPLARGAVRRAARGAARDAAQMLAGRSRRGD